MVPPSLKVISNKPWVTSLYTLTAALPQYVLLIWNTVLSLLVLYLIQRHTGIPGYVSVQAIPIKPPPCLPQDAVVIHHLLIFGITLLCLCCFFMLTCLCIWCAQRRNRGYGIRCLRPESPESRPPSKNNMRMSKLLLKDGYAPAIPEQDYRPSAPPKNSTPKSKHNA